MAKISRIAVPASLQQSLSALTSYSPTGTDAGDIIKIKHSVKSAQQGRWQNPLGKLASSSAAWLVQQWKPYGASSFFRDRREEILAGNFDQTYWFECLAVSDRTSYAVPTIAEYGGGINYQYFDAFHMPTQSTWKDVIRDYPTVMDPALSANPMPGWHGQLIGNYWHDIYLAQRHYLFSLPKLTDKADACPLVLAFTGSIKVTSTRHAHSSWFQLSSSKAFLPILEQSATGDYRAVGNWARADTRPISLPAPSLYDWSHEEPVNLIRDARTRATWKAPSGFDSVMVDVAIPPSNGYMFSLNEWATVRHFVATKLYMGKGPND